MSIKTDPNLKKELREFGVTNVDNCYHCGNCTATCPLSTSDNSFPRKMMKYVQMGLKDKIKASPEPWLCYYCGDCSVKCPRGAEPGENMMAIRRYLTSLYDWTGFSKKFYTSEKFEYLAIGTVGLIVGLILILFHGTPDMEHAKLNSVWPAHIVEIGDVLMGGVLAFLLLSNTWRCISFILGDLKSKIPMGIYISQAKELIIHFLTQKKFAECEDRMPWFVHLMIMTGYATVFLLVVGFLAGGIHFIGLYDERLMFQRDIIYPLYHPIRLLGYYSTFALFYGVTYAMIGRLKKSKPSYKFSHSTDWMFLILLQLTTLTGILIHVTRLVDLPMPTYALYVIHMMVCIPMLVLEVPFAKWAHLAYRPVAIYLTKVKAAYVAQAGSSETAE
ncbi:MAG: 4Fe-4S dicluster domain-containing protein [Fibrobacteria bacterium]|nr:4Fe-4S dicluster domain-containing protein [Fibrobacteria bacterium]